MRARAFTMMELAVALGMSVVVIGAITGVLSMMMRLQQRERIMSELQRDGEFASQLLSSELRQAGLGVPSGEHIWHNAGAANFPYGTVAPASFGARRVLVAGAGQLAFLGDLPKPDASYPTFGPIHNRVTGNPAGNPSATPPTHVVNSVAWHTESNGDCVPDGGGNTCAAGITTATASQFFPGDATTCTTATPLQRTCPWALGRVFANDSLQIVDGAGNWAHAHVVSPVTVVNDATHNGVMSLSVSNYDYGVISGAPADSVWRNTAEGDGPGGTIGQGWVTTLDRVFYEKVGTVLQRTQCFGDPDPANAKWPPDTATAFPAAPFSFTAPCVACGASAPNAVVCTPAETVARNVTSVAFSYFDATGTGVVAPATAALKNSIARVGWHIVMTASTTITTSPVTYTIDGSVELLN